MAEQKYFLSKMIGNGDADAPNTLTTGAYRCTLSDLVKSRNGEIIHQISFVHNESDRYSIVAVHSKNMAEVESFRGESGDYPPVVELFNSDIDVPENANDIAAKAITISGTARINSIIAGKQTRREILQALITDAKGQSVGVDRLKFKDV